MYFYSKTTPTTRTPVKENRLRSWKASYSNKEYALMAVEALEYLQRELEEIADEATTDCYNEYEQIA
jgi:hypothetical protein